MHALSEQQPSAHDVASQTHVPPMHSVPGPQGAAPPQVHASFAHPSPTLVQTRHVSPLVPHAGGVLPASQLAPEQHPEHCVGSQVHEPLWHFCPAPHGSPPPHVQLPVALQPSLLVPQSTHVEPPTPQVDGPGVSQAVPPAAQQPEHEPVVQAHAPCEQTSPVPHDGLAPHSHTPAAQRFAACGSHVVHAPPPVPQLTVDGNRHLLFEQHPVGHDVPSHTQLPSTHSWPRTHIPCPPQVHVPASQPSARVGSHDEQAVPPVPHAETVGVVHVAPTQHPPLQFALEHPVQAPPEQEPLPGHAWHDEPPVPHAELDVPAWHIPFPSQQPLGHELTLQAQLPFEQIWPDAQAVFPPHVHAPAAEHPSATVPHDEHVAPGAPHVAGASVSHTLFWQQPPGQEVALQTQVPPTQACPVPHA